MTVARLEWAIAIFFDSIFRILKRVDYSYKRTISPVFLKEFNLKKMNFEIRFLKLIWESENKN